MRTNFFSADHVYSSRGPASMMIELLTLFTPGASSSVFGVDCPDFPSTVFKYSTTRKSGISSQY